MTTLNEIDSEEFCKKILKNYLQLSRKFIPSLNSISEETGKPCKISANTLVRNNYFISTSDTENYFLIGEVDVHESLIKRSKLREIELDINFSFTYSDLNYMLKSILERGVKSVTLSETEVSIEYKSFPNTDFFNLVVNKQRNDYYEKVLSNFEQINMEKFTDYIDVDFKVGKILIIDSNDQMKTINALHEYKLNEYKTFLRFPKMLKNLELLSIKLYDERLTPNTRLFEIQSEYNNAQVSVFFKLVI